MGNVQLGRLSILAGVRVERTETEGEGALQAVTPEESARRAAFTGPLTEAEITRRTIAEFGGRQVRTGDYQNVLPGVHFKFGHGGLCLLRRYTIVSFNFHIARGANEESPARIRSRSARGYRG